MDRYRLALIALLVGAWSACAPPVHLLRGQIRTLARGAQRAEAIAFSQGKILAIGALSHVRMRAQATGLRVVESPFEGTLVPGLADAHGHLFSLGRKLHDLDVSGMVSYDALVRRVRARAAVLPAGTWIRGRGWDQTRWPGGAFPHHTALSRAVPDHPVALRRVDGHAVFVNAAALIASRIEAGTQDPLGGRILRDGAGQATGVLVDNAMELVPPPRYGAREIRAYLRAAVRACVQVGLTSVHDMGTEPDVLRVLREMAAAGELPLRVVSYLWAGNAAQLDTALRERPDSQVSPDFALVVRGVKLIADGAMGSRGAALVAPYDDEPGQRGHLLWPRQALRDAIAKIARAGFQPAVHAIGDLAVLEVMSAFARIAQLAPRGAREDQLRVLPRIEHLQLLPEHGVAALTALARAGVVASMQPTHLASDQRWVLARVGAARAERAYAWSTARRAGAILAFGSDFPVESPDPRLGLHAAVTRGDLSGALAPFGVAERLSRESALRAFTAGPARAAGLPHLGGLAVGQGADFTIFGEDPLTAAEGRLANIPVLRVYVRGEEVYRR